MKKRSELKTIILFIFFSEKKYYPTEGVFFYVHHHSVSFFKKEEGKKKGQLIFRVTAPNYEKLSIISSISHSGRKKKKESKS